MPILNPLNPPLVLHGQCSKSWHASFDWCAFKSKLNVMECIQRCPVVQKKLELLARMLRTHGQWSFVHFGLIEIFKILRCITQKTKRNPYTAEFSMEASPRLLILLLALGFNQQAEAKFNRFSGLSERAIIQARNETTILLDDAVQHPNATGRWPIIGIDVSKPLLDHPTTEDYGHGNGWSIDIAVATNVSTEGVTNSNPSRILLKAPENAFEDLNSTTNAINNYSVCAVTWFTNSWTLGEIKKLNEDVDGSCNGVISTECIKDLKQTLAGQPCSRTSSFTKPESCKDALSSFSAFQSTTPKTIALLNAPS